MQPTVAGSEHISVIIPTKNRCHLLREALASVRQLQGTNLKLEVIVADNGSTDETATVASQFGARLVYAPLAGAAAARNAALRVAGGDFIAFLDDDDIWLPSHLGGQLELMRRYPELAGAVGQVQTCNENREPFGSCYPRELPADGHFFASFLRRWPQIGATVVRRRVLDTVGYFDETLEGPEDWDWHLRLARRHRLGFVAQPCVLFRVRTDAQGHEDELNWQRLKCNRRVLRANALSATVHPLSLPLLGRVYLNYDRFYVRYFLRSAAVQLSRGQRTEARRAVARAAWTSPAYLSWRFVRDAGERRTILDTLTRRR